MSSDLAPRHKESGSSDEEAPETISLTQSKQSVHRRETELKKAEILVKERKREENRERDRKLKERAERNRGKQKEKSGSSRDLDLEARMQRAMQEAQDEMGEEESGDEEEFEGFGGLEGSDDDESGEELSSQEEESGSDNDESDMESNLNDSDRDEQPGRISNPDHLPDELFEAAFKASTTSSKRKVEDIDSKTQLPSRKRKRNNAPPKDLVIGSRAIRVLPEANKPSTPSARPSRKIRKFLDRTLALKGGNPEVRGWERRPVNIGVMRRNGGPAANFVRG